MLGAILCIVVFNLVGGHFINFVVFTKILGVTGDSCHGWSRFEVDDWELENFFVNSL